MCLRNSADSSQDEAHDVTEVKRADNPKRAVHTRAIRLGASDDERVECRGAAGPPPIPGRPPGIRRRRPGL